MKTDRFRFDRRADSGRPRQRQPQRSSQPRSEWLDLAAAGLQYFGVTLLPLLVAIMLYQFGVIA